jgi:ligand-binding SRPBCC domain-containing protein
MHVRKIWNRADRLCAMSVSFECTTLSALAPERLFDLARDITAHTDSMSRSRETAVGGIRSGVIGLGEHVTWRAWHFGLPLRMTSRITAMEPPQSFTDEQTRGPFRYFTHEHTFRPYGAGCLMIDRVSFSAPLGFLGQLVERLVLAAYMRRLIEQRNSYLQGIAG